MDGTRLQGLLARGQGRAAARIGTAYAAYRPADPMAPMAADALYGQLFAAFNARDPKFQRAGTNGQDVWWGVFDTTSTLPGDYLAGAAGTFFIAAQQALLPPVCVLTNRIVSLSRPDAAAQLGVNGYGGVRQGAQLSLLTGWPASVGDASKAAPGLPGEQRLAAWTARLPTLPVSPRAADMLTDDLGQSYVVVAAGQTDYGWQLGLRQMT